MTRATSGALRRRAIRRVVVAVMAIATALSLFPMLPATPSAGAQAAPPSRPMPAPARVSITDAGYQPAHVAVVIGQSIVFTNDSANPQTVRESDGQFDSGTIAPGGAFSISLSTPGHRSFATATAPNFTGSLSVGQLEVTGPATQPVRTSLPAIAIPPVTDRDVVHGISASRSRITVMFRDTVTVGEANAALADAGVIILGTLPDINAVLVGLATPPAVGDFAPLSAAAQSLRASPAVMAAALDLEQGSATVPPLAEDTRTVGGRTDPNAWLWTDARAPSGGGQGDGGNWGLEAARFPQAWNFFDPIASKANLVDTLVFDSGFPADPGEVPIEVKPLCFGGRCSVDYASINHGTHVAGTIGAAWANPMPAGANQPGKVRGVDGGNPFAHLYGALKLAAPTENEGGFFTSQVNSSYLTALEGKTTGLWPNLRVMNMSLGSIVLDTDDDDIAAWGGLWGPKRCGPGANDDKDDAVAHGPCTLSTDDFVRHEVEQQGLLAKALAAVATAKAVTPVISAGNQSGQICEGAGGAIAKPVFATPGAARTCPAGMTFVQEDVRLMNAWGWASASIGPGDTNPFVIVEAHDIDQKHAWFSEVGGDVSAPGVGILSTTGGGTFNTKDGTSQAAPHVTALVGYLYAAAPELTPTQIRHLLRDDGQSDVTGGTGSPRIDAFNAVLGIPGAPAMLLDVNDASPDGNRRIERTRTGEERPDTYLGQVVGGRQLHTSQDKRIDMRDVRRYRDAVLAACTSPDPGARPGADCPAPDQIELDGAIDHPKKDLNLDGCVYQQPAVCVQPEEAFSRFDFNGDGTLALDHQARLPLRRDTHGTVPTTTLATGEQFTDLSLLQAWFDADPAKTEGWPADQLRRLLVSGDVEVHADALFQGGADHVDVTVDYGNGQTAPVQRLSASGNQVVVTAPVENAGSTVTVSGVGYKADGTVQNRSFTETTQMKPGSDRRVDLCSATVTAVSQFPNLFADGESSSDVQLSVQNCGRPLGAGIQLQNDLTRDDGSPATATVSSPTAVTDDTGRAKVAIKSSTTPETLKLSVTALVETDPSHAGPEQVTQAVKIDVQPAPRVIYKWEQVTDDWSAHVHRRDIGGNDEIDYSMPTGASLVIGRSGTLTKSGDSVRYTEHVGGNVVPRDWTAVHVETGETRSGQDTLRIPTVRRVPDPTGLMSSIPTNRWLDNGEYSPFNERQYSQASIEVAEDQVTVDHFEDMGSLAYEYDPFGDESCSSVFCEEDGSWDQLELTDRKNGSAIAYSDDLTRPLSFRRLPNGAFTTQQWCSAPKTFEMRGLTSVPEIFNHTGSARSRFRFIATVTTDPTKTGEDLVLPENCVNPVAPVASFTRDVIEPVEGRVVHFLDTSRDDNGDISIWRWDFGDGQTSTEQDPHHRYEDDGTYRVTLTVTDGSGLSNTTTSDITVTNGAPEISADDVTVASGEPVVVNVRLFDPSERDQEYLRLDTTWEDGAGPVYPQVTTAGGAAAVNLGVLPDGTRRLRLRVQDKDGKEATVTITVTVGGGEPGPPEPPIELESPAAPGCAYGVKLDAREQELLDLANGYRATNHLDPISPSPTLTKAATAHARWLRDQDLFQHEGPGGSLPLDRALAVGYPTGTRVGENLARGPREAYGALVLWKMSRPHDDAILTDDWAATGIAAVDTAHGTIWVQVFGTRVDCPLAPPDFDPATDPPDPVIVPDEPPVVAVLSVGGSELATEPAQAEASTPTTAPAAAEATAHAIDLTTATTAPPPSTSTPTASEQTTGSSDTTSPPSRAPPSAVAANESPPSRAGADGADPVVAFTMSTTDLATGEVLTVTNRSTGDVILEPGDGRPGALLAVGASVGLDYLDPGTASVQARLGVWAAMADLTVTGAPRPPTITYTGPQSAAFGSRPVLTATLTTGVGAPVVGRTVVFSIDARVLTATTDAAGIASATLIADLPVAAYTLAIDAPPLATGPGASTSAPFTVGPNAVPVVDAHGPYEVVLGEDLRLDTQGTYDPDGSVRSIRWDLDDDGEFDDATDNQVVPAATVAAVVCGGTCDPATPEAIAVEVTDSSGGVTVVRTEVRTTRDFRLSLSPANAVLVPNAQTSFLVSVTTTSGFADPVQLSAPSLPPGVTATFRPATVTPGQTSFLTLAAASDAQAFNGQFVVRGTSGAIVRENPGSVTVDFGLVPLCYGAVDARIVDAETGQPLVGAYINFRDVTGADGVARLRNLNLGLNNSPLSGQLSATADGHYGALANYTIGCGVITQVEFRLSPHRFGRVEGRMVVGIPDPNDHRPTRAVTPTNVPLVGTASIGSSYNDVTSDPDGRFAFDHVRLPVYGSSTAYVPGYWADAQGVALEREETWVVQHALVRQCTASIDVRVRDGRTGLPLKDVVVSSDSPDPNPSTDAGGRARVTNLLLGPRNSTRQVQVYARATLGGRELVTGTQVTLADCGSIAQVDLFLTEPLPNRGSLVGRVTNDATGDPVAGLSVVFDAFGAHAEATTDADGRYRMEGIVIGFDGTTVADGAVRAVPPNTTEWLGAVGRPVRITKDATTTQDLTITPRKFTALDVRVLDAATGEPIVGADVRTTDTNTTRSDRDGYAHFEAIPTNNVPLAYGADAYAPGYVSGAVGRVVLQPDVRGYVEIRMDRLCAPASIQGTVRDASTGLPLEDAQVSYVNGKYAFTDAAGFFRFTDVDVFDRKPTRYGITAGKPGYQTAQKSVTVFCGSSLTLDLSAPNTGAGSLSGRVTRAADDQPVAGVVVSGEWGDIATTDANGRYSFSVVPLDGAIGSRDWGVTFVPPYAANLETVTRTVTIRKDEATSLDVALGGPPPNLRPTARSFEVAAPDGRVEIPLTMEGTDPDGDPVTYRVATANSTTLSINHDYPTARLTARFNDDAAKEARIVYIATDGKLDSAPAEIILRRNGPPVNQPPTARVTMSPPGPYSEPASFTLDGSTSSDPESSIASYAWDLDNDGEYDDNPTSSAAITVIDSGVHTYGLRVTDDAGLAATTSLTVTVANVDPVVDAGNDATLGTDRHLQRSGSFVDPGADAWTATVDWGDGGGKQLLALTGKTFSLEHTYAAPGTFTAVVEVCDDDGGCGSDSFALVVPGPSVNLDPTALITGPTAVAEGSTTTLSGSGSTDPDGTVVAYDWDVDGDGAYDDATGPSVDVATPDDGSRVVGLRVRDDDGAEATATHTITATNVAPAVDAGGDASAQRGTSFRRSGSFTDPGADSWVGTVDWDEGAGPVPLNITGKTFELEHTFGATGSHSVVVEVCDDDRGCASDEFVVTVTDQPPTPSADLHITVTGPERVTVGAAASWQVSVRNDGPDDATDLDLTITAPAGFDDVRASGAPWTCTVDRPITCTTPSISAGGTAALTIEATAGGAAGSGRLGIVARSAVADPDLADNQVDLDLVVSALPTTTTTSTTSTTTSTSTTTTTTSPSTTTTSPSTTTSSTVTTTNVPSSSTPSSVGNGSTTIAATNPSVIPDASANASGAVTGSAPSGAAATTTGSLPATGTSSLLLLMLAMSSIVGGAALLALRRMRQAPVRQAVTQPLEQERP